MGTPNDSVDDLDSVDYSDLTEVDAIPLGPGTEVGGYVIDGVVGRGGMGVVYRATHPVIGKRAAIKVLREDVSKGGITVERFIQEARAVNAIGHPNIIDIFAFGTLADGRAFHVMDLLEGEPLRARLKRGPLPPSEAAHVIDDIASALAAAHDKGFVHRDLKPDNVFLVAREGRWPEVKLLDFGLCKLMPEAGIAAQFKTKTGLMLGTPEYMAPEQARGQPVDYRTDIYALGIVLFEVLTGRRPFAARGTAVETLQAHLTEVPPSLALVIPDLPDELVQLAAAMLAKAPEDRPSLAAVRTVIKRLRTLQLPSYTKTINAAAADSEISALGPPPSVISVTTVDSPAPLPPTVPARPHLDAPTRPSFPSGGLRADAGPQPGTVLGVGPVGPSQAAVAPPELPPTIIGPRTPVSEPPLNLRYLVIGAVIAIIVGVGFAVILTRT